MARFTYYIFPDEVSEDIRLEHGCKKVWDDGVVEQASNERLARGMSVQEICEDPTFPKHRYVTNKISCTVRECKKLIKKYGGHGYTCHCDRDGGVFEVTPINLTGNNSRFTYSRHL